MAVTIKLYRLIGYDKDNNAYDITRAINIDTEQFINEDINKIDISDTEVMEVVK